MQKTVELMSMELIELLEQNDYRYEIFDDDYIVHYHDDFGNKGLILINIDEETRKYDMGTIKNDSHDAHNHRQIKSLKAVENYIERLVN